MEYSLTLQGHPAQVIVSVAHSAERSVWALSFSCVSGKPETTQCQVCVSRDLTPSVTLEMLLEVAGIIVGTMSVQSVSIGRTAAIASIAQATAVSDDRIPVVEEEVEL